MWISENSISFPTHDKFISKLNIFHSSFKNKTSPNALKSIDNPSTTTPTPTCLCTQIKWIWHLSQMTGINPLTCDCKLDENTPTDDNHSSSNPFSSRPKRPLSSLNPKCSLSKNKKSFPFWNNLFASLFSIIASIKISHLLTLVISFILQGTDAYASRLHLGSRVVQTAALILIGGLTSRHLVKAWEAIQTSARALNHQFPKHIRIWSISLTLLSYAIGCLNAGYMAFMAVRICFFPNPTRMDPDGVVDKCFSSGLPVLLLLVWTLCSTEFCHVTFASLTFVFSLIVRSLHKRIAFLLQAALENELPIEDDTSMRSTTTRVFLTIDEELERLRLLHEKLNQIVVHLRRFFGVSALAICLNAVLSCIVGGYWRILYYENLNNTTSGMYHFIAINSQAFYSVISLLLILSAGQIFANSSFECAYVLQRTKLSGLNTEARFQVTTLLQSISGLPTKFSVYSITNIEMPFLAAAATNVITYLLVLMQFRLESGGDCNQSKEE